MTVIGQNATIYAGNKHTFRFPVTDQDTDGSPAKNITGMAVRWALSKFKPDGSYSKTPVLTKNSAISGQITITSVNPGEVDVNIAEGDTSAFEGDYYQELELYSTGSFSLVVATGTVTIERNLTNP